MLIYTVAASRNDSTMTVRRQNTVIRYDIDNVAHNLIIIMVETMVSMITTTSPEKAR